jgi:hypothetical protein
MMPLEVNPPKGLEHLTPVDIPYWNSENNIGTVIMGSYKPFSIGERVYHVWVKLDNGIVFDSVLQRFYYEKPYNMMYETEVEVKSHWKEEKKVKETMDMFLL